MILVFLEQARGEVTAASLEALTFARKLAAQTNVPLHALVSGTPSTELAERAGAFGVSTLHAVTHAALDSYAPDAFAASVMQTAQAQHAHAVLASGTERGNEIMARVAAKMNLPLAVNVIDAQPGDHYTVMRLRWGGSLLEQAALQGATKLMTVAPDALAPEPAPLAVTLTVNVFTPALEANDVRVRVTQQLESAGGKVSLGEAKLVVGGGRGVGSAEGFKPLEELADLLDGAVGGSRAVTSLGWRAHADQIGQTGNRIAPELYIACGISGAIQHMVGCKAAKHILAINTDPEAPIVSKADYAVIGDLHQVVPAITAEIHKRKLSPAQFPQEP